MQERPIVLLAAALAASIAVAGVTLPAIGMQENPEWHSFELSVSTDGEAVSGHALTVAVDLRQGMLDPKTLRMAFLSLDIEDAQLVAASPGTNPWGYPTIWNITDLDLTAVQRFTATIIPMDRGVLQLRATVWTPRADVSSVPVDPTGHVNPAGVSVLESQSLYVTVG